MKIMLASPCAPGVIKPRTAKHIEDARHYLVLKGHNVAWGPEEGPFVQCNQNAIALAAVREKVDKVVFIETDMIFTPPVVATLAEHDLDIVACTYRSRAHPFPLYGRCDDEEWTELTPEMTGLKSVTATGTGLFAVKPRVFEKMSWPYFNLNLGAFPEDPESEANDGWFFHRAREAGFKVWVDMDASRLVEHPITMIMNFKGEFHT